MRVVIEDYCRDVTEACIGAAEYTTSISELYGMVQLLTKDQPNP